MDLDGGHEERRNVTILLRWIGGFLAFPGLSIGFAFLLDFGNHVGHFFISMTFGLLGVLVLVLAPRLAARFVTTE